MCRTGTVPAISFTKKATGDLVGEELVKGVVLTCESVSAGRVTVSSEVVGMEGTYAIEEEVSNG